MKKYKLLVIVIVCFIFFTFSLFENIKVYANDNETINDGQVIRTLKTEELIKNIVDNELSYINLFSTQEIGISKFKLNNQYYKELITRENIRTQFDISVLKENTLV